MSNTESGIVNTRTLIALPLEVVEIPQNAHAIGMAIADLRWPRRKIVNRMQLRFDYFLDAGHQFRSYEGDPFNTGNDRLDKLFNDPAYKWFSDFARRCKTGPLTHAPSLLVQKRLQLLELGLRTPPLGYAI
ncbi:hypothetical protein TRP8649_02324 [Pelagimonas phthalicica]|uniref:Uncharacterized protein n=1 Tax=Pelagimonas phthalicica TaxID=1037362 RepID=A0A238JC92_9RHOB|nr:hypothetical protein [Pelagimonas phthalicica]TDS91162.1 hypothetical protein CLV87_2326 [Pelagimonas phthalicica]SMX28209.1 hypothetical protein TRP8649_02324 [Pelagimonas phthalicica]